MEPKMVLCLSVSLLLFSAQNRHVKGGSKGDDLDCVHLPQVAAIFLLRNTQHVAQSYLVERDHTSPFE